MFTGGFELYVPGPGCVSTSPMIRKHCKSISELQLHVDIKSRAHAAFLGQP
jgi:hypothetical protein